MSKDKPTPPLHADPTKLALDDDLDGIDEVTDEPPHYLGPPLIPEPGLADSQGAPTKVEVTFDTLNERTIHESALHSTSDRSRIASQLDDTLGPANAPKEILMPPTNPVPTPAAKKPRGLPYAIAGIVTVVAVLVAVGVVDPTKRFAERNADTTASARLSLADEAPDAFVPPPEIETPEPVVERPAFEANPTTGYEADEAVQTVAAAPPEAPVVVAVPTSGGTPPTAVVVAAAVPPAPLPAPKATLPESLVVSATGLKPACKAACAWANVDPKDGFPYTLDGKRDVTCGAATYSVSKWEKIKDGKQAYCFTATGLSEEPAGP